MTNKRKGYCFSSCLRAKDKYSINQENEDKSIEIKKTGRNWPYISKAKTYILEAKIKDPKTSLKIRASKYRLLIDAKFRSIPSNQSLSHFQFRIKGFETVFNVLISRFSFAARSSGSYCLLAIAPPHSASEAAIGTENWGKTSRNNASIEFSGWIFKIKSIMLEKILYVSRNVTFVRGKFFQMVHLSTLIKHLALLLDWKRTLK